MMDYTRGDNMLKRLSAIFIMVILALSMISGCSTQAKKPAPPATPKRTAERITPRISAVQYPPTPPADPGDVGSKFQRKVVELVNVERQKVGNDPLVEDALLDKGATLKADDMKDKGYFSHTSPTYGTAFKQMNTLGVDWQRAGENIASGYKTPETVVKGWMDSPGHRANILSPKFGKIGIGYAPGGNADAYWVQWFTN